MVAQPHLSDALESLPPVPAAESIPEQELPAWVDENASLTTGQALPTLPEEWLPAETKAENISAHPNRSLLKSRLWRPQRLQRPSRQSNRSRFLRLFALLTLKQTGMLSHIRFWIRMPNYFQRPEYSRPESLDEAMKKYSKLIKKGRLLDEVIHDLREAIYRYPVM